jgi:hypothetical protein
MEFNSDKYDDLKGSFGYFVLYCAFLYYEIEKDIVVE